MMSQRSKFAELKKIFETLHGPRGCLWDKKQTHKSLIADLKEEVEEFIDTVKADDPQHMKEELGDLLLHVMFNAQIAAKNKKFDIEDVIDGLIRKLKHRHPHVFGNAKVKSAREIIRNWNKIKKAEKQRAV
jgi:tetrapyrrole methylase family protein / MazG family protein